MTNVKSQVKNKLLAGKKNDGYVLPAVIIFIVFSIIMGMTVLEIGTMERVRAIRRGDREAAFYLAEAGIEKGIIAFLEDGEYAVFFNHDEENSYEELGVGQIWVSYNSADNAIVSKGIVGFLQETIEVYLSFGSSGRSIFAHAIFTDSMILK